MLYPLTAPTVRTTVRLLHAPFVPDTLARLEAFAGRHGTLPLSRHPGWLQVLQRGFGHTPYVLEATAAGETVGVLPLAFVRSLLFGRFLVGLPYLNSGGIDCDDPDVARALVGAAVELAEKLRVRHLELRHEAPVEHPALGGRLTSKVHMRLALPSFVGPLWE